MTKISTSEQSIAKLALTYPAISHRPANKTSQKHIHHW